MKQKRGAFDYTYFMTVMILVTFGLIMVFSASSPDSYYTYNNSYLIVQKQLLWVVVGLVAMFIMASIDYRILKRFATPILVISFVLLLLVPIAGVEVKGAKRWLGIGTLTFQPSELAKLGVIIYFSYSLSQIGTKIRDIKTLFFPYLTILAAMSGLLLIEPHFSGTFVIVITGLAILFIAGARGQFFGAMGLIGAVGGAALILFEPYRWKRITAFMNPLADKLGSGWQITQSLYAIGSGGLFGVGLGRSRQKFLYIPEPQNDFIYSILCEELGYIGAIFVMLLFVILIWRGIKIAITAPDTFGSLMAFGITILMAIQVVINIAVVTASMPITGMPLPFFSAGGSSMLFLLAAVGIMLNISRYSKKT